VDVEPRRSARDWRQHHQDASSGRAHDHRRWLCPAGALAASKTCIAAAGEPGTGGYSLELEATRRLLTEAETRRRVEAFLAGAPG